MAIFIHFLPGDPAYLILGEKNATPEKVAAVRAELGLDRPILAQYVDWLAHLARGDLGESLVTKRPIAPDLAARLPRTFELILVSTTLAILIGVPSGVIAASHRNRAPDTLASLGALVGVSIPEFVLGALLLLVFGVKLNILPATGYVAWRDDPLGHVQHLALPAITLAIPAVAIITRVTRSSMLEILNEDFIRTARGKGLHDRVTLFRHALPNALIPVITLVGLQMGSLLGGSVLVEYIFNWPGVSTYLNAGIMRRDYPVVQAVILVVASLFILLNLLTDLLYAVIDPRVKYGG